MARQIDGLALGTIAAGSLFTYAGIKGYSIPHAIQALVQGQPPSTGGPANPITGTQVADASLPESAIPHKGQQLTAGQVKSLWIMAGGSPAAADTAVCIASHESSFNASVTSGNPDGGTNVGLWQLDTPGGKGAGYSIAQLQDPLTNARVAVAGSSNGTDWSAWATAPMCGV